MAILAYLFFVSVPSFAEIVPIATLVAAVGCAAVALYVWQPEESAELSELGGVNVTLGSWAIAGLLFGIACWLRDIPLEKAVTLPEALWRRAPPNPFSPASWGGRLFWLAMTLSPGVTLIAIGSVVRRCVLRTRGAL
jgi:hypothetical protein